MITFDLFLLFLCAGPRCAFEVSGDSPPYSGVRGQGMAKLFNKDSHGILERLHDRFLGRQDTPFKQWLLKNSENEIRYFLKLKMYNNKDVLAKNNEGKLIIKRLFNKIEQNPKKYISDKELNKNKYRVISDFISSI